jgi:preprotein translocase subunit YajC
MALQAVGPKAGTPGTTPPSSPDPATAPSAPQSAPPNTWMVLAPMLIVVVFMLFTSRSQKKREAEVRAKLKKGDRVVAQSGLIGELVDFDDKVAKVKIAPGTTVQMLISAVSPYESQPAGTTGTDKALQDLKDAKATADKKG